jgi:hypothetical protein
VRDKRTKADIHCSQLLHAVWPKVMTITATQDGYGCQGHAEAITERATPEQLKARAAIERTGGGADVMSRKRDGGAPVFGSIILDEWLAPELNACLRDSVKRG